jgi:hypothetical protein
MATKNKKKTKNRPKKSTKKVTRKAPAKKAPKKKTAKKKAAKSRAPFKRKSTRTRAENRPSRFAVEPAETQSGDLQGLSDVERADSESVDELLEEGNAFEAGVVQGVEEADDSEPREVHTHEVPEDDVPEEYLDEN